MDIQCWPLNFLLWTLNFLLWPLNFPLWPLNFLLSINFFFKNFKINFKLISTNFKINLLISRFLSNFEVLARSRKLSVQSRKLSGQRCNAHHKLSLKQKFASLIAHHGLKNLTMLNGIKYTYFKNTNPSKNTHGGYSNIDYA